MKTTTEPEVLTSEQELNRISYFRALNRRRFLTGLGATGVAAGAPPSLQDAEAVA